VKLYIKQKVFSWTDKFTVKDEDGYDRYDVRGEFSFAKKLHVYTADGQEAAYIEGRLFSWMPRYMVYVGGTQIAEVVKEFTFFRPRYRVDGPGWAVDGDFWAHDYEILQGGRTVGTIRKEWMTWGDCYELSIENSEDEISVLAIALAIDCAIAQAEAANS